MGKRSPHNIRDMADDSLGVAYGATIHLDIRMVS